MRFIIMAILLMLLTGGVSTAQVNNCIECHQSVEEEDGPSYKITRDVHFQKGLGCVDCHGGDAALEDMDDVRRVRGYRGVPSHTEVPEFCGGCHGDAVYMRQHNPSLPTDQLTKYKTSTHGQLLFGKRDDKVANCISCHGVHDINSAKLPHSATYPMNLPGTCAKCHGDAEYMSDYDIPTDQYEAYAQSVHGQALLENKDLGAPACNDCHSNHGAAPPGVNSLSAVCGQCHAMQQELFEHSPHAPAFAENEFPMCETCHGNHLVERPHDDLIGDVEPAYCVECHDPDDGTRGIPTALAISESLHRLVTAHDAAKEVMDEAMDKGMMTADEEFGLKEVGQILIKARTQVHAFNIDSLAPKAEEGIKKADEVKVGSAALIDEYYFRRKGLGLATLFITVVCIGLYARIRRLKRK
ncbi:MAG: cytochrome c3 family protein [bacterium]